jgi:hypothetical protein
MIFLQYVFTCTAWEFAMRTVLNIKKSFEVFTYTLNNHYCPFSLSREAVPLKSLTENFVLILQLLAGFHH